MATLQSKRKRDPQDMPNLRPAPPMEVPGNDFHHNHYIGGEDGVIQHTDSGIDFAAVLSAHNNESGEHNQQGQQHPHEHQLHHDHHHHQHQLQMHQQHEQDREQDHMNEQHHGLSGEDGPSASDTAAAAMAQYHTMTVPQTTEQTFMRNVGDNTGDKQDNGSTEPGVPNNGQRASFAFGGFDMDTAKDNQGSPNEETSPSGAPGNQSATKLQVGSDEWHKVRKDNHKEVERRRRETINEGINELSKIVPGCEKNKGSILARAVQFITQLKENETQNIEKWTLEKLLTEQAIAELSSSCDKLKAECQRAWAECEQWKKAAQKAGVAVDDEHKLIINTDSAE